MTALKLPQQVQDANERAEQAIRDAQAERDAREAQAGQPEPTGEETETPATEQQDQGTDTSQPNQNADPSEPGQAGKEAVPKDGKTDWKAKYHTLQGMFNAEVPRLHKELKAANARIEELAKSGDSKAAEPSQDEGPTGTTNLHSALVEALGNDAADAISKLIESRAGKEELATLVTRVEDASNTSTQAAFMAALDRAVPDWRQIDSNQDWLEWLADRERFARKTRQELIAEAYRDGDVEGVSQFFEAFKAERGAKKPDTRNLERQVTPATTGSAAPVQNQRIWTKQDIASFYKDMALGKYPADKAAEIEQDIVAAGQEGRVR